MKFILVAVAFMAACSSASLNIVDIDASAPGPGAEVDAGPVAEQNPPLPDGAAYTPGLVPIDAPVVPDLAQYRPNDDRPRVSNVPEEGCPADRAWYFPF